MVCDLGSQQMKTLPTYLPTQGKTVSQLSVRKSWWNGPYWLNGPETEWPKQPRNDINVTMGMMAITDSPKPEYLEDVVDPQRTSKYLHFEECRMDITLAQVH